MELGNIKKSKTRVVTQPSAQSPFQKSNFGNSSQGTGKSISNFSCPVQFYWISVFCSKYFVQDCSLKRYCKLSKVFQMLLSHKLIFFFKLIFEIYTFV